VSTRPLALVFDGGCRFCTLAVAAVKRVDRGDLVSAVPCQSQGLEVRYGVAPAEACAAAWAVDSLGHRHRGAPAVIAALTAALGVPWLVRVAYLPGFRELVSSVYTLVARNRSRLPGIEPYCATHALECGDAPEFGGGT
jgi:predicted DCC family thiol-disulfide oxidoreductase YuxK